VLRNRYRCGAGVGNLADVTLRAANIDRLRNGSFDVFIVGGGINGAVAAAALAGRGVSVALVDRGDFAGFTSQESSNLVWGGFKYLENYEFLLVRNLCMSRNRLTKAYPDNVKQIGFLASLDRGSPFPPWLAALGSTAYWGIGNFRTNRPRLLRPETIKREEPSINIDKVRGGIEYFDAYLKDNDARFVFGFVRSAIESGAAAANYVELTSAVREGDRWQLILHDVDSGGAPIRCSARAVINAAGPFVDGLNSESFAMKTTHRIVYSKGIHLIVPRISDNERVLAFFDDTQRLFYVIPMGKRSVIGTTDTRVEQPVTAVTDEDRSFLLEQINARLTLDKPLTTDDIIAERCGVRPLVVEATSGSVDEVDWTSLSRKHAVEADQARKIITIFGGKLTDCLNVGEEITEEIEKFGISLGPDNDDWYGEPNAETRAEFYRQARLMRLDDLRRKADLEPLSDRLWRRYGVRAFAMLDAIRDDPSMGDDIMDSADYLRVELHVAAKTEMVTKLEDFLRRRSKISLVVRNHDIVESEGLREVCTILFGDRAQEKYDEYCNDALSAQR
jgi:glycerol-3-phosphate dehydrogenase